MTELEEACAENEALKTELKEVLDVLLKVSPKHYDWVMLNWGYLYNTNAQNTCSNRP